MASKNPPGIGAKGAGRGAVLQDARARDEAERQDRHRTEELVDACGQLEEELEQLKARYELHFVGIERREPAREREQLRRRVAQLKGQFTRNTGLRFRIETLHARYLSYERMWTRSAREKEEGTYRRDLVKARRHAELQRASAERSAAKRSVETPPASEPTPPPVAPAPSATPAPLPPAPAPAPASAAPMPPPAAPAPPGISREQLRGLYAAYVEAKRRCNEDVSRLTFDSMARAIEKQVPQLMAKYRASAVEFKVIIQDGRALLKAIPKA